MKLVITEPWGHRLGGAENMLWTLVRHLDRRRIEPLVVFFQPGPFEREVASLGIPTLVLPAGRLRQGRSVIRVIRLLASILRRERPDLLLNWMAKSQLYGASAAMLAGMANRVVWWQHEVPDGHWLYRLASLLPARAVGCSSRSSAEGQARQWPRRPIFVVNPGIDVAVPGQNGQVATLRRQLGIPDGCIVIGNVGRLQPSKRQDRLLRVVARLRESGRDVLGLVVGGDAYGLFPAYPAYLHGLVDELGISDAVRFTGQVPDAGPYMELMSVLVHSSEGEPFGIVLLEAMARGIPVVAFDACGPAEIIETGRSGLLVPDGDEDLLLQALQRVIGDLDLRRRLQSGARQRYETRFTADRMVGSIEQELEALAAS